MTQVFTHLAANQLCSIVNTITFPLMWDRFTMAERLRERSRYLASTPQIHEFRVWVSEMEENNT